MKPIIMFSRQSDYIQQSVRKCAGCSLFNSKSSRNHFDYGSDKNRHRLCLQDRECFYAKMTEINQPYINAENFLKITDNNVFNAP